jgi:hypothetical protein
MREKDIRTGKFFMTPIWDPGMPTFCHLPHLNSLVPWTSLFKPVGEETEHEKSHRKVTGEPGLALTHPGTSHIHWN